MSESKINMSLDDIIKKQRKPFKRGGNQTRGGRGGRGGHNQSTFRGNRKFSNTSNRALNKNTNRNFNSTRGNRGRNTNNNNIRGRGGIRRGSALNNRRRLNNQRNANTPQNKRSFLQRKSRKIITTTQSNQNIPEKRCRLILRNLDSSISNTELRSIFEKIGPLKRCGIHWDELGNSKGSADIEFYDPIDASNAIKEYDGAEINKNVMYVEYAKNAAGRARIGRRLGSGNIRRRGGRRNNN